MKLNNLPDDLITGMNKSVAMDTSGFKRPIEAIFSERMKTENNASAQAVPSVPKVPMISIDDHILPADEITMLMYLIATVFSKDPKVRRVLNKFQFNFKDVNGNVIYPANDDEPVKRKKRRHGRSK